MEDYITDEELSYSFASILILKKIVNKWRKLKELIASDDENVNKHIEDFDKLINYFY